ncbi:MAG TPA: DinB family protein [Bryobacteraceae bacterium]|jgi:uncharacterized damage-inducible protein DinB|nr:DinB family protein [Bryobacteraceae bacterium]
MQPEQAEFLLRDVLIPSLQNEHGITKRIMAAVPDDRGDYKPDPTSMTAFELARHIATAEMTFMQAVIKGEFPSSGGPRLDDMKNVSDVVRWYEQSFQQRLEEVSKLPGEQLAKIIDFRGVFQLPAVMYLNFLLNHSIHHRGQMTVYLRPMGAKVPNIYGESYDGKQARQAAPQTA